MFLVKFDNVSMAFIVNYMYMYVLYGQTRNMANGPLRTLVALVQMQRIMEQRFPILCAYITQSIQYEWCCLEPACELRISINK